MDTELWLVVKDGFNDALVLEGERRLHFLSTLEPDTRREVEALLRSAEGVLDEPLSTDLVLRDLLPKDILRAAPSRTHAAPSLMDARLGPYRVGARIGRGGMGDVYRARRVDGLFDREVALKVIRDDADTAAVLDRFAAERRILGALEHPGIARLIGAGAEDDGPAAGRPWLALELVEGVPITEAAPTLDLEERVRLVLEVAQAVHHAHRRLVVHRDLKPSNVLVTVLEDGTRTVKLLDFGIAKLLGDDDLDLTAVHERLPMTRAYASPEQVRGEAVTTATDVYGLGLLLFEVVTGTRPFSVDGGVRALEDAILTAEPPLASTASRPPAGAEPARLRGDLDVICRTALAKEPDARYASAEAFAADLGRWLQDEPIEARAPSRPERVRRFVRKHRLGVIAAGLIALAILGGAVSTLLQARQTRLEADRSEATADFLVNLFQSADPTVAAGDTLTVLSVLDRGARRLERELAGQPATRADLYVAIGQAYFGLGRADSAEAFARRAFAVRRPEGSAPDAARAAAAEVLLGRALYARNPERATDVLRQAIARARVSGDDAVLLDALEAQGVFTDDVLPPQEAVDVLEEAIGLSRGLEGEASPRLGRILSTLAGHVASIGQHGRTETLYRDALDRFPAEVDPFGRSVVLLDLSEMLQHSGREQEARRLVEEAAALRQRLFGLEDARTAEARAELAFVLTLGPDADLDEAERMSRAALEVATRAEDDAIAVQALQALRRTLQLRDRFAEAAEVSDQQVELATRSFGLDSPRLLGSLRLHAMALTQAERYDDAAPVWDDVLRRMADAFGADSPSMALAVFGAASEAEKGEQTERADALYARASDLSDGLPNTSRLRASVRLWRGRFLLEQKRPREAVAPLRAAVAARDLLDQASSELHRSSTSDGDRAAAFLGEALMATGATDEGRRLLTVAARALTDSLGADHRDALRARTALRRAQ